MVVTVGAPLVNKTTAEGSQLAGEGRHFGPEGGTGREPDSRSGYTPIDAGHFHRAVAERLTVQFGHEKTPQSPRPRALSGQEPAEHGVVIEGASEHLSGLGHISTLGHLYLKTSNANRL
jgi:hypothetical protein